MNTLERTKPIMSQIGRVLDDSGLDDEEILTVLITVLTGFKDLKLSDVPKKVFWHMICDEGLRLSEYIENSKRQMQ